MVSKYTMSYGNIVYIVYIVYIIDTQLITGFSELKVLIRQLAQKQKKKLFTYLSQMTFASIDDTQLITSFRQLAQKTKLIYLPFTGHK